MKGYSCFLYFFIAFCKGSANQLRKEHAVKLGEPVHFTCNLHSKMRDYFFATFNLESKGKVLSSCKTLTVDSGTLCEKPNNTDKTIEWSLFYDRNVLNAVEAIKLVTSPMDAGVYSCVLMLQPNLLEKECLDKCQNKPLYTISELEIIPSSRPIPMINYVMLKTREFQMEQPDVLIGCFFNAESEENLAMTISNLDVSIKPNELFDPSKKDAHYTLQCCDGNECISIKLISDNSSPFKRFYLPTRDLQINNVIVKSARVIQKKTGDICGAAPRRIEYQLQDVWSLITFFSAIAATVAMVITFIVQLALAILTN